MSEIDEKLDAMLAAARDRPDVSEYLRLRAENDAVRSVAVSWLITTLIELIFEDKTSGRNVKAERVEEHAFELGPVKLSGEMITLQYGVRRLTVEAGWPRSPGDGFMRQGALAAGSITHFGVMQKNESLRLLRTDEGTVWTGRDGRLVDGAALRTHLDILLS